MVDVPVPQIQEQIDEVKDEEGLRQVPVVQTVEMTVEVPKNVYEAVDEAVKLIPQERVQNRMVEIPEETAEVIQIQDEIVVEVIVFFHEDVFPIATPSKPRRLRNDVLKSRRPSPKSDCNSTWGSRSLTCKFLRSGRNSSK